MDGRGRKKDESTENMQMMAQKLEDPRHFQSAVRYRTVFGRKSIIFLFFHL